MMKYQHLVATTFITALLSVFFVDRILAQDEDFWSGCGPFDSTLKPLTIGEKTVICLHIGEGVNWARNTEYIRASFSPKVDEYSRFHIPNSYEDVANIAGRGGRWANKNITVGVASQQRFSFLRIYFEPDKNRFYPYLTAIIDVDKGKVRGVTWDDGCLFCGGFQCDDITYNYEGEFQTRGSAGQSVGGCHITAEECASDPVKCDLLLYVVWSGTDSKGNAFQSSASRFSMFPMQNLGQRLTRAAADASNAGRNFVSGDNGENNDGTN